MNMTPKTTIIDKRLAAWLGDATAGMPAGPDPLAEALDSLFAAGPSATQTAQAQARLRRSLAHQRQPATRLFYEKLPNTPIGPVYVAVGERGLVAVRLGMSEAAFVAGVARETGAAPARSAARAGTAARQMREYLAGKRTAFDVPVDLSQLSDFQRRVLLAASQVPRGQVATYTDIARRIGKPGAARAVGQALSRNPVPIVMPCHRVLAADGSLRGYLGGGGVATKARLLELEGARSASA
jgi:methylated-DNA-[protein]-cysteine S-methyltransferase